jgi:hypothetical protein
MRLTNWNELANFTPQPWVCKCGQCKEPFVSREFMQRLQRGRSSTSITFPPTSGSRCASHNTKVRGAANSDHLFCETRQILTVGGDIAFQYTANDKAFIGQLRQARNDAARFQLLRTLLETTTNDTRIVQFLRAVVIVGGLDRIGISYKRNFVHVGMGGRNPPNVCWFY